MSALFSSPSQPESRIRHGRYRPRRERIKRNPCRPHLEQLEDRTVPTVIHNITPAAIEFDPTFGDNGEVVTDFDPFFFVPRSIAVQADQKILAADVIGGDFGIARYLPNGELDHTFSFDGLVRTNFGDGASPVAVVPLPNGKILAAGSVIPFMDDSNLGLARYHSDGTLDPTFGVNGKVITDLGRGLSATGVTIAPDGKILVVGGIGPGFSFDFFVARYLPDGELDVSFNPSAAAGIPGFAITDFGGNDAVNDVIVQPDGKILAVGATFVPMNNISETDFAVARYLPDGRLDPEFGNGGTVITDFAGRHDTAEAVTIQPDGRIVVAGGSLPPQQSTEKEEFAVARYLPNGSPDSDFDADGKVRTDFGFGADVRLVSVESNGDILAVGVAREKVTIARYRPDGGLNPDFGGDGRAHISFNGQQRPSAIARQADGKILVGGATPADEGAHLLLSRYRFPLSPGEITVDGIFTDPFEWADVLPLAFIADTNGTVATSADDPNANARFFAAVRRSTAGDQEPEHGLHVLVEYEGRTNKVFADGEFIADIMFPATAPPGPPKPPPVNEPPPPEPPKEPPTDETKPGTASRTLGNPIAIQIRGGGGVVLPPSDDDVIPIPAEDAVSVLVDMNGDGAPDVRAEELGIQAAVGFGKSQRADAEHLIIELALPLNLAPGFATGTSALPEDGLDGIYAPDPAVWTVHAAADPDPAAPRASANTVLAASALVQIDPDATVTANSDLLVDRVVAIDVKPGSDIIPINLGSKGVTPVAVLSTPNFDATTIDPATIGLANPDDLTRTSLALRSVHEDVDGDGDLDLQVFFRTQDLVANGVVTAASTAVVLTAQTSTGETAAGTDTIRIVPGERRDESPARSAAISVFELLGEQLGRLSNSHLHTSLEAVILSLLNPDGDETIPLGHTRGASVRR